MTAEPMKVREARAEVERSRAALLDTLSELKERLAPRTLAADAWDRAKSKTADLAEDAVDAVKARPAAVGGALAALTLFLARDPVKDGVRNLYEAIASKKDKPKAPARRRPKTEKKA
ncbi:DUF3618 domain-containing protein [Sphingomonas sp. ASV193]|uniref:DUF3618 domain-containing protein n=1 Tax=Sphingomonas sp. ASV193 TaxID=3144405 RepID=UPI0032E8D03A